jgi:hypothetical protein
MQRPAHADPAAWEDGRSKFHRKDVPMTDSTPNLPEPYRAVSPTAAPVEAEFHISEFAAEFAGGMSPFGDDVEFPLPVERLGYRHPGPADRPHLAGD